MRAWIAALLLPGLAPACEEPTKPEPVASASPSAAPPPVFDADGFCEKAMALAEGRTCSGAETNGEGNKVGFCTTLLRTALDADTIAVDLPKATACAAAAKKAAATLPDRRTLRHLAEGVPACRGVVTGKVKPGARCDHSMECADSGVCLAKRCTPRVAKGAACKTLRDVSLARASSTCASDLSCVPAKEGEPPRCTPIAPPAKKGESCALGRACEAGSYCPRGKKPTCTARGKAGDACRQSDACLGRCDKKAGKCLSYCASG